MEHAPHEVRVVPAPARASGANVGARLSNRTLQRLAEGPPRTGSFDAPQAVESAIDGARGQGSPLDREARADMEHAFGADFGGVRIHQDDRSHQLNRALDAQAFTSGHDVFFSRGAYQPGTSGGRELLAHELTHVVQQTGTVQEKLTVNDPGDSYEQEADRVSRDLAPPGALDDEEDDIPA
jgi:hypothetical protein